MQIASQVNSLVSEKERFTDSYIVHAFVFTQRQLQATVEKFKRIDGQKSGRDSERGWKADQNGEYRGERCWESNEDVKGFRRCRYRSKKLSECLFLAQQLLTHLLSLYPRLLLGLSTLRLKLRPLPVLLFLCGEPNYNEKSCISQGSSLVSPEKRPTY